MAIKAYLAIDGQISYEDDKKKTWLSIEYEKRNILRIITTIAYGRRLISEPLYHGWEVALRHGQISEDDKETWLECWRNQNETCHSTEFWPGIGKQSILV